MTIEQAIADAVKAAFAECAGGAVAATEQRLYTLEGAARYLGCSPSHVRNLIASGVLPVVRWPQRKDDASPRPYLDKQDLDRAIVENKHVER